MSGTMVWRCLVCGYLHRGPEPPEECPLCGAGRDEFEPVAEPAPAPSAPARAVGRIVVVGGGIAGVAAAEAARETAPGAEIVLVSREPGLPYYRLNLTRYLAGEIGAEALPIHPAGWYAEKKIELLAGTEAEGLDLAGRAVVLDSGRRLVYERLVLAAGAYAFLPPIPGIGRAGVSGLRTLADTEEVLGRCGAGARCIVIGGGILGLEAAGGLARRGARVTVLEGAGWLLPRQLDRRGGEILADFVRGLGVRVRFAAKIQEITGGPRVEGVRLEGGERLETDLVIVATGIRANGNLARWAGLKVGQGIVVDDRLGASHPDVLAAGDAAEHRGVIYGLWGPAQYQGRIAGMNAAGGAAEFGGLPRANTLKVLGVDMFSIGRVEAGDDADTVLEREGAGEYCRLLLREGRLAGAILIGQTRAAAALKRALEGGRDLSGILAKRPGAAEVIEFLSE